MTKLRLHKAIADAGFASRRAAEELIRGGKVSVNGEVVTEMGVMVDPNTDRISIDGTTLGKADRKRTYLFYKPLGVLCTRDDPHGRSTVFDVLPDEVGTGLHTAGRLDMDAEGLLILTNDGDLTLTLTHPSRHLSKTYLVKVKGEVLLTSLKKLRRGVELEDGMTLPASVSVIKGKGTERNTWLRIVLREGKKNQIKRMCEAVGHRVLSIKRISIGGMALPDKMKPGSFKKLSKKEIETLLGGRDRIIQSPPTYAADSVDSEPNDERSRRGEIIVQSPKSKDQREEPESKSKSRSWKPREGLAAKRSSTVAPRAMADRKSRDQREESESRPTPRSWKPKEGWAAKSPSTFAKASEDKKSRVQRRQPGTGSSGEGDEGTRGREGRAVQSPSPYAKTLEDRKSRVQSGQTGSRSKEPEDEGTKKRKGWAIKSKKSNSPRGKSEESGKRGERTVQSPSAVAPRAIAGRKSKDQRGKPEPGSETRSGRSDAGEKGKRGGQPSSRSVRDHSSAGKKIPSRTKRTPKS